MATQTEWQGTISNTCECAVYDPDTDTTTPLDYCDGSCFDDMLYGLAITLGDWFTNNDKGWWEVDGLPLWNRSVSGLFHATKLKEFVRGVTIRGDWRLHYQLSGDTLHLNLAHHDVPMGRGFTVRYGKNPDYYDEE